MMKLLTSASVATLLAIGAASAQTTTQSPPGTAPQDSPAATQTSPGTSGSMKSSPGATTTMPGDKSAAADAGADLKLTDAEAKNWIGKNVFSSNNEDLGEVVAFQRAADGTVEEMHADIGGFLGIGESRVRLMPSQFKVQDDRIVLNLTSAQAKELPKVAK